jgi:hypothetical protein
MNPEVLQISNLGTLAVHTGTYIQDTALALGTVTRITTPHLSTSV